MPRWDRKGLQHRQQLKSASSRAIATVNLGCRFVLGRQPANASHPPSQSRAHARRMVLLVGLPMLKGL
jgi:hypothetical protein